MDEQQQAAGEAGEAVRQKGEEMLDEVRKTGQGLFEQQAHVLSQRTGHLARALHDTAHRLREENEAVVGNYAAWAAQGLERLSGALDRSDFDRVSAGVNRFVREQPALFLGGTILAGIVLSRMLASPGSERAGSAREATGGGLEEPATTESGLHPRATAEYGELETRKPGAPQG